jgi:hypothetical protein
MKQLINGEVSVLAGAEATLLQSRQSEDAGVKKEPETECVLCAGCAWQRLEKCTSNSLSCVFHHGAQQTPLNNDLHSKASLPCVKTGAQKKKWIPAHFSRNITNRIGAMRSLGSLDTYQETTCFHGRYQQMYQI